MERPASGAGSHAGDATETAHPHPPTARNAAGETDPVADAHGGGAGVAAEPAADAPPREESTPPAEEEPDVGGSAPADSEPVVDAGATEVTDDVSGADPRADSDSVGNAGDDLTSAGVADRTDSRGGSPPPDEDDDLDAAGAAPTPAAADPHTARTAEEQHSDRHEKEDTDARDNVGAEVRAPAAEPNTYEELGPSAPVARARSSGSQTDAHAGGADAHGDDPSAASGPTVGVHMTSPSVGVQADVREPAPPGGDGAGDAAGAPPQAAAPVPPAAAAGARQGLFIQAASGFVVVNTTVLPMNAHTFLRVPVLRTLKSSRPSGQSAVPGEGCWMLSARGLFEALATRLCVHPQAFRMYRNGERVRFQHTMVLDADWTSCTVGETGEPAACDRAEPVWITIRFAETDDAASDPDADADAGGAVETGDSGGGGGGGGLPAHLAAVNSGEVIERCIYARRVRPELSPETLVEGRRQGISFDELVRRSYAYDRGIPGDTEMTATVAIVRAPGDSTHKPFLGGYRVVQDPTRTLLHASTQLFARDLSYSPFPAKRGAGLSQMCSRQTQTLGTSRSCQTTRECCVQTSSYADVGGKIVMDDAHFYVVTARPYFTAADLHRLRVDKAIVLQRVYRQWHARGVRRALEEADAAKQQRAEARQREEEAAQRARESRDHLRRAAPRTAADFAQLAEEVVRWRVAEAARVTADASLTPAERQALLLAVTKEQMRMLQELEHRRRLTLLERKDEHFHSQLARAAEDRVWGAAGIHVTTRETVRAGELRDLYAGLTNHGAGLEGRLDVLLHVKWTVAEFASSPVGSELVQLIDREADLLHRGRREASLVSLRRRIELLFRQLIEDPAFNPGIVPFTSTAVGRQKVRELGLDSSGGGGGGKGGEVASTGGGSPYGGYQAANCACCSTQLRVAAAVGERSKRASAPLEHPSGTKGGTVDGSTAGEEPEAAFSPAATA